jgi:hypothetical protein
MHWFSLSYWVGGARSVLVVIFWTALHYWTLGIRCGVVDRPVVYVMYLS